MAFNPDVVVRYWGGDQRLLRRLEANGTTVLSIDDSSDFNSVRNSIRVISEGLQARGRGEALIGRMDRTLGQAAPVGGPRGSALYLTAGGFTAGRGTLIDAILAAAGFDNAAKAPFFAPVSVERIALSPPKHFVLGFFDMIRSDWRGPGRHPVVKRAARGRVIANLPSATLTCPAWFAADAAVMLKAGG